MFHNLAVLQSETSASSNNPTVHSRTVEAKQDKFEEGWGQCLAEMIAVQRINNDFEMNIFGIVSNGKIWQFGKLTADVFTRNKNIYVIQELDKLFAAVNYVFQQCELQINKNI